MYILNMSFEPGQGRQALVTGLASVLFLGGAGSTWSQHKQLAPLKLPNALLMHSLSSQPLLLSTATPLLSLMVHRVAYNDKRC